MTDLEKLVDQLSELTVLEAADLTKLLEEKWGVSAAAPVAAVAAVAAGGASDAAPAEEKSEWNVVIQDHGAKKIDVKKKTDTSKKELSQKKIEETGKKVKSK